MPETPVSDNNPTKVRRPRRRQAEKADEIFDNPNIEWLTYEEVARLVRVSRRCVERYVALGKMPMPYKPGGWFVRFNKAEIEAWLSQKRRLKL